MVLGSMKELGADSEALHRRLGTEVAKLDVVAVFFFGTEAEGAYQSCADGRFSGHLVWTDDFTELKTLLKETVKPGDLVVLKGSRSNELERLQSLWNVPQEAAHVL
jgi:UDP-N-acetylmuramoyl-tripeptide--D-alanyl-D-alanine ligase